MVNTMVACDEKECLYYDTLVEWVNTTALSARNLNNMQRCLTCIHCGVENFRSVAISVLLGEI